VDTRDSVAIVSGVRDIEKTTPVGGRGGILRGARIASSAVLELLAQAVYRRCVITTSYQGPVD
jgi:hypothetical protein